jgi:hypothetical protein
LPGRSVKVSEWRQRPYGWWVLRVTDEDLAHFAERNTDIRKAEADPGRDLTSWTARALTGAGRRVVPVSDA